MNFLNKTMASPMLGCGTKRLSIMTAGALAIALAIPLLACSCSRNRNAYGKDDVTRGQLRQIYLSTSMYEAQYNMVLDVDEMEEVLMNPVDTFHKSFRINNGHIVDGWDTPVRFVCNNANVTVLASCGPNQIWEHGGCDDLVEVYEKPVVVAGNNSIRAESQPTSQPKTGIDEGSQK